MIHSIYQPHQLQVRLGPSSPLLPADAGIDEGELHVVQCRSPWQEVEGLEDEADLPVANTGELVVGEVADLNAVQPVLAFGGRVQAADEVHERRLPAPRRTHDSHELTWLDLQIHSPQSSDGFGAQDVVFTESLGPND